jgi:hypothetical protein
VRLVIFGEILPNKGFVAKTFVAYRRVIFVATRGVMPKIAEVLERLAALEATIARIGHNGGPPIDDDETPLPPKHKPVLISDRQTAARYDVVVRTVERWDKQPELGFPPAVRINRRRYRVLAELEEWDRRNARKAVRNPRLRRIAQAAEAAPPRGESRRREKLEI